MNALDGMTPQEMHTMEMIQHLREKRHSLRAQLDQLATIELQKAHLQGKLQAVEDNLKALGWEAKAPEPPAP